MDVESTRIVATICLALRENVRTLVLRVNVVKRRFVAQQIIVRFAFAQMDSPANPPLNVFKLNVKLTKTVIWTRNAYRVRAKILAWKEVFAELMRNVELRIVRLCVCVFLVTQAMRK